jgi:hypothetical protein
VSSSQLSPLPQRIGVRADPAMSGKIVDEDFELDATIEPSA